MTKEGKLFQIFLLVIASLSFGEYMRPFRQFLNFDPSGCFQSDRISEQHTHLGDVFILLAMRNYIRVEYASSRSRKGFWFLVGFFFSWRGQDSGIGSGVTWWPGKSRRRNQDSTSFVTLERANFKTGCFENLHVLFIELTLSTRGFMFIAILNQIFFYILLYM